MNESPISAENEEGKMIRPPGVTVPGFAFWLEAKKCNMRSVRLLLDVIASHPRCSRNWRRLGKLADGVKKMQPAAAHLNSSVRLCKATLGLGDGTKLFPIAYQQND